MITEIAFTGTPVTDMKRARDLTPKPRASNRAAIEAMDTPVCRFAIILDPDGNQILIHNRKSGV